MGEKHDKNNEFLISNIELLSLINLLTDIYDMGIEYIDIIGTPDDKKDKMMIRAAEEKPSLYYKFEKGKIDDIIA